MLSQWCWHCSWQAVFAFACTLVQSCFSFVNTSPPKVQGDGGEKVGHKALALKIAKFKDFAEDGAVTLLMLDEIMPFRFLMTDAELALTSAWAKQALGASADSECTALVAQGSADLCADKSEQGTSSSVMSFFG